MDLKNSGLLFVLIVVLEAVNGLALNNTASAKTPTQDLPALHSVAEKSQTENGSTTETVKIIIPNTSEIIPKSNLTANITSKTNPSTTAVTRAETTTPKTNIFPIYVNTSSVPTPEKGTWSIRNEANNMTCIIVEMALQLNVTYPGKKENTIINIPKNSVAKGVCSNSSQSITLAWGTNHTLQINFTANKTTNNFYISEFLLNLKAVVFNATDNSTLSFKNDSTEFVTPLEMSYKCNRVQYLNLESEHKELKAVLSLSQTQFEAFMNKSNAEFGAAQDCDTFDTPDVVPIAVGCALAVLVLVVLVAYLIGRKRSQNRGYLSM